MGNLFKIRYFRIPFFVAVAATLLISFQQCSNATLEPMLSASFNSAGFPFTLKAPTQYPSYKRYVFLVDMSYSMVSGPCPFDVDVEPQLKDGLYYPYDPNASKRMDEASLEDARALGQDCYVDPNLPVGVTPPLKPATADYNTNPDQVTYRGNDFDGLRFRYLNEWLTELRTGLTEAAKENAMVMIIPVSGGSAQEVLNAKMKLQGLDRKFYNLQHEGAKLDALVEFLKSKHDYVKQLATTPPSIRNATEFEVNLPMGSSVPAPSLKFLHDVLNRDMIDLTGNLSQTTYDVVYIGDGVPTPLEEHYNRVREMSWEMQNLPANLRSGFEQKLEESMRKSWGAFEDNKQENIDFHFGILQTLPVYHGASYMNFHFIQLNEEHVNNRFQNAAYDNTKYRTDNLAPMFSRVMALFQQRFANAVLWKVSDSQSENPLSLVARTSENGITNFKMTHLYLLNTQTRVDSNGVVRIDSDGDGLFDDEDANPLNARANGFCLDSMMASQAIGQQCNNLRQLQSCDPMLDLDGDSLNECEEMALETDPLDFDTDNDSIPDSLEWLYGYSGVASDKNKDSNSDGVNNLLQFAAGLPPLPLFNQIADSNKITLSVNRMDQVVTEDPIFGSVKVDQYQITIQQVPMLQGMSGALPQTLISGRPKVTGQVDNQILIPSSQQLLKSVPDGRSNRLSAIARVIDPANPQRAYWFVYDLPLNVGSRNVSIDLNQFQQIKSLDRYYDVGDGQ